MLWGSKSSALVEEFHTVLQLSGSLHCSVIRWCFGLRIEFEVQKEGVHGARFSPALLPHHGHGCCCCLSLLCCSLCHGRQPSLKEYRGLYW